MKRTDHHRPSELEPANYRYVAFTADAGYRGGFHDTAYADFIEGFDLDANRDRTNQVHPGGCDCCGHRPLVYRYYFEDKGTQEVIVLGSDCVQRMEFESRETFEAHKRFTYWQERMHREAQRDERREKFNEQAENVEAAAFLDTVDGTFFAFDFLTDVRSQLRTWGGISDRQVAAVLKLKRAKAERESRPEEPSAPVEVGRGEIVGTILSTREQPDAFKGGYVTKMLVRSDVGFKVWGTCPQAIVEQTYPTQYYDEDGMYQETPAKIEDLKGQRIKFVATVKASNDDPNFGFFSRPTKATLEV